MRFRIVQTGCGESLEDVDPARIHRMSCALVYMSYDASSEGVHPASFHRMSSTLV